jgi:hypothetical protein
MEKEIKMKEIKFKMEIYDKETNKCISIVNGSATDNQIDRALDYLLKIKEEGFINERTN